MLLEYFIPLFDSGSQKGIGRDEGHRTLLTPRWDGIGIEMSATKKPIITTRSCIVCPKQIYVDWIKPTVSEKKRCK